MALKPLLRTDSGQWILIAVSAIPLLQLSFPHLAYAEGLAQKPTFEIKIESQIVEKLISGQPQILIDASTVALASEIDPLSTRKQNLYRYFTEIRPSPLANYVDILAEQPQWRKIIAISFVESTMCKRNYFNNCWGITYRTGLAKYPSFAEAIIDANRVLAKSYANSTYRQMNCVYVQPCNSRWVNGALQIETELDEYVETRVN